MVKPGEARDVEYEWDTSGFAWDENRKNQSEREIRASLEGGNTETAKIKILPKPVVMVHGLWSNAAAWAEYPVYLREAHSFAWKGYAVGADPEHGKMSTGDHPGNYKPTNTIYQNAQELAKQIKFTRESNNAWHVDVVAHSMGGLISRQYINTFMKPVPDGKPEITHLVMLGTPNMGSPCADTVNEQFEEYGASEMHAMRELKPVIVRAFNTRVTDRKGVKFSVLVGVIPVPRTCLAEGVFGDGVVPIESAKYNLTDYEYAPRNHIALTGIEDFKGFVLPRLAVGPKKARAERATAQIDRNSNENYAQAENTETPRDRYGFNRYFQNVSYKAKSFAPVADETGYANVTAKEKITIAPKQAREIAIPDGSRGVLIVADTGVVATLTDASGTVLGKSEGGLEAMRNPFRMILPVKQTTGAMKLKLENFGAEETVVFAAAFAPGAGSASLTIEAGKPSAAGTVPLTAKWTENGAPVLNAKITGVIVGNAAKIEFFDDGRHADGQANDGIYGATTEKLAKGEYFIEAKAEANGVTKLAVAPLRVGSAR
jgi:pimeloyl-ACP methyl ester carboxylesterase